MATQRAASGRSGLLLKLDRSLASAKLPLLQLLETSKGVEVGPVSEPIAQAVENSPGVEVDRVQDVINQTWTSWEKEYCAWLKNAKWCIHQGENKRIHAFLPTAKTLRLEGMKKGAEYCPIWEVSECTYDYSGLEPLLIPVCSSLYAQEPIEVDRVSLADRTTCTKFPRC